MAPTIPAPGTKFGPCEDGCVHYTCTTARDKADEICHYCEKPIGYETEFFKEDDGKLVHKACLDIEVEDRRRLD